MRVALDVDAAIVSLEQLRGARDGVQDGAADLLRPQLGLFPPDILGLIAFEQLPLSAGLRGSATAVQLERRRIAARVAAFQLADGGAPHPSVRAVLEERVEAYGPIAEIGGTLLGGLEILAHLETGVEAYELALLGLMRLTERSLPRSQRTPFSVFHGRFEKNVVGRAGRRTLGPIGFVMALRENYERTGAATPLGRHISAFGAATVTAFPFVGLADFATGGGVSGSIDAVTTLGESGLRAAFSNPSDAARTLERWSESALNGQHGPLHQSIARVGDSLGGALYDTGETLHQAGEQLGGKLHMAAHEGRELLNSIPRPKWLGG